jgi:beta-RFAP synthase
MTVWVEAAARLHFGVLDPRGVTGRRFGGVGAAAPAPTLLVSASRAGAVEAHGEDAQRAAEFARRALAHFHLDDGVRVTVERALPLHAGLGSGTQLGLAVGRAVTELFGVTADAPAIAAAVGRGRRSAVGTWTFADGGLVVEGGHAAEFAAATRLAPLVARLTFPASWRCVVAVPHGASAMSGTGEDAALEALPAPSDAEVRRVADLVHAVMLPAVLRDDLPTFGKALSEVQCINGRWFAPAQGGIFAPGASDRLARRMIEWGVAGVGQSSWGPTVYGIVEGEEEAAPLAASLRDELGSTGQVYAGAFRTSGARVWRAADHER